jgi:hypothetical protein
MGVMGWRDAERWWADIVGGTVVTDQRKQLEDIDVEAGLTWSVKCSPAVARYNNFSFETELERSDTGERVPGNFALCRAQGYVIVVPPWDLAYTWRSGELKTLVAAKKYPVKSLTAQTEANNAGRRYDRSWNIIVPVRDLEPFASTWHLPTPGDIKEETSASAWMLGWPS